MRFLVFHSVALVMSIAGLGCGQSRTTNPVSPSEKSATRTTTTEVSGLAHDVPDPRAAMTPQAEEPKQRSRRRGRSVSRETLTNQSEQVDLQSSNLDQPLKTNVEIPPAHKHLDRKRFDELMALDVRDLEVQLLLLDAQTIDDFLLIEMVGLLAPNPAEQEALRLRNQIRSAKKNATRAGQQREEKIANQRREQAKLIVTRFLIQAAPLLASVDEYELLREHPDEAKLGLARAIFNPQSGLQEPAKAAFKKLFPGESPTQEMLRQPTEKEFTPIPKRPQ